jgi:hypothetical protein
MRDPKRIPVITEALKELWLKYPDLRLWQLLMYLETRTFDTVDRDLFYLEDDEALAVIQSITKEPLS